MKKTDLEKERRHNEISQQIVERVRYKLFVMHVLLNDILQMFNPFFAPSSFDETSWSRD